MKKIFIIFILLLITFNLFAESENYDSVTKQLIEKLIYYVENAENFLIEQTPEYIMQLLHFKSFSLKIWTGFCFIPFLLFLGLTLLFIHKGYTEDDEFYVMAVIFGLFTIAVSAGLIKVILLVIKINIAPKVYILEYLMTLKL